MEPQPKLADRRHMESWGGALLQEIVEKGRDGLSPECQRYAQWAREDFGWWRRLESPNLPSWNWDMPLAAALLWLDPEHGLDHSYTITDWWDDFLSLQIGEKEDQALPISRHFDGTETLSSVYGAGRYGSVAAVRLLALRFPSNPASPEILRLTGRYLEVLATLLALSSRPWTDPGYSNARGARWYEGPTVAPVGERSEAAGLQTDNGPILALLSGTPPFISNREGWPAAMFRKLFLEFRDGIASWVPRATPPGPSAADADLLVRDLAGVRLWSEQHWTRWQEGLLVWKPRRQNNETAAIFWAWLDDTRQEMTIGYPWPKARNRHATGQGNCQLTRTDGGWRISAAGVNGGTAAVRTLPVAGDPTWSIVGDQQGFREESLA